MKSSFITGKIEIGEISLPSVSTLLKPIDYAGAVRVRWGIDRDNYKISPGIYAIGFPSPDSDVFVTSNYKLTFDLVRKSLSGIDGWLLVLDTKGVNVWCAAGKGTFGTKELVNRIKLVSLDRIVNHKRLILPQLSATGVAAYKVKEETGFNVHFGPVRASDLKKFLADGYRADKEMRKVSFNLKDRVKLIPNDLMYGKYYLLGAMAILFLLSGLSSKGISYRNFYGDGGPAILKVFLAYLAGILITPMFLPYIPGRYFSLKGFFSGLIIFIVLILSKTSNDNTIESISWFFIITTISSFIAMNWTGSSTFTSLSGVKKEMKISIPVQIGFALIGISLQVVGKLI